MSKSMRAVKVAPAKSFTS